MFARAGSGKRGGGGGRGSGNARDLALLGVLVLLGTGVLAFAAIADAVDAGSTEAFDRAVHDALRDPADPLLPAGPTWLREVGRDVTALGSPVVLWLVTLGTAGFLFLGDRLRTALFVLGSVGGGALLSELLKAHFARARPLPAHALYAAGTSFPSSHALVSAVTYLTLAVLVARVTPRRRVKVYVVLVGALVSGAVGASRVYIGVHWPTDVLAGWVGGGLWALACGVLARQLQRRGRIDPGAGRAEEGRGG